MRDLNLRFEGEAAWAALGINREPGLLEIDVVGMIAPKRGTGEATQLVGYLVNVRCLDDRDLSALERFQVFPAKPVQTWLSGGVTIAPTTTSVATEMVARKDDA
ncbi:hypothetical protein [Sphingomonas sp. PP-CE-1G-424]|uniref:hypothetical protein n=1 Tax=Sphingomonas sp. PP-CE-1G-424 TaxID=2135658 RepID=UPI001054840F|nr:hypothetical protein [Sphingomonas sp. PP-CE-1G-424]TCP71818.1 hypothetical protein C8J43_102903 [Sphingomonas sp. PP-CE-1G-424]